MMVARARSLRRLALFFALALLPLGVAACGGSATTGAPATSATAPTATATAPTGAVTATSTSDDYGGYSRDYGASPSPTAASSPSAAPAQGGEVQVQIVDFRFEPARITVAPGTTVVWTNVGPTAHTATSKADVWDSGILQKGQTFRFTFRTPGTYDYWCTLHPNMLGQVVVR